MIRWIRHVFWKVLITNPPRIMIGPYYESYIHFDWSLLWILHAFWLILLLNPTRILIGPYYEFYMHLIDHYETYRQFDWPLLWILQAFWQVLICEKHRWYHHWQHLAFTNHKKTNRITESRQHDVTLVRFIYCKRSQKTSNEVRPLFTHSCAMVFALTTF